MPEILIDGAGTGNRACVSTQNRLCTESKSRPSEEVEAEAGKSFILHGECHTAAATSGGLMYFTNTDSSAEIVITRIYIDSHTITPSDLVVLQVRSPATVSNGTDISTTGIVQKSYGLSTTLTGSLVISDGSSDMTYTGGTNYHSFPIKTMSQYTRNMIGTNIVSPNTTILWGWKTVAGGNATDAEIISLSVNCFKRSV